MEEKYILYVAKDGDNLSKIVDMYISGELFPKNEIKVEQDLTWEMVWNDSMNVSLRSEEKSKGELHESETVYLPFISMAKQYKFGSGIPTHISCLTGRKEHAVITGFRPIVDSHMHIQSLHATPLPLMWAAGFFQTYKKYFKTAGDAAAWFLGKKRKTLADKNAFLTIAVKDFGKIGRFSTDLIAKIYMRQSKNSDMKKKLYWLLSDENIINSIGLVKESTKNKLIGGVLGLEGLSVNRRKDYKNFEKLTAYYYQNTGSLHMSIVMPMDLSYANFWGAHGLPINLPVPGSNTFCYINDFVHLYIGRDMTQLGLNRRAKTKEMWHPENNPDNSFYHLSYDFDLQTELDNYLHYMEHSFGSELDLPEYNYDAEKRPFKIHFNHENLKVLKDEYVREKEEVKARRYSIDSTNMSQKEKDILKSKYDSILNKLKNEYTKKFNNEFKKLISQTGKEYEEKLTGKMYKHYIGEIPGDSTEKFEDYWLQRAYTEASAYRYPLNLIPFYHYEPRRYYQDPSQLEQFSREINKRHGFYKLNRNESYLEGTTVETGLEVELVELKGKDGDYYLEMFKDSYVKNFINNKPIKNYNGTMELNTVPLNKLYPEGIFMGVKVYPALGYPGDLYDRSLHEHPGGDYYNNQFKTLDELYKHCVDNNLPITTHCSPLGMSIGDGFNYEIRDELKRERKIKSYDMRAAALYVDDTCGHPKNWERVLKKHKKLKLCLAHFGGMGAWTDEDLSKGFDFDTDWRGKISELIANSDYPNVYTDISCYTMGIEKLPKRIDDFAFEKSILPKLNKSDRQFIEDCYVYKAKRTGSYYKLKSLSLLDEKRVYSILREVGYISDKIEEVCDGLVEYIGSKNEKLKERVLMGSDWYMAEVGITGLGSYYMRMFDLLRLVTKKLNKGYDAWHQFAVINPLNYLGFLKSDSSGNLEKDKFNDKEVYVVDIERVEKMLDNLTNLPNSREWVEDGDIVRNEITNFIEKVGARLKMLKRSHIYTAEEMKKDGELMITSGF